jgi:hypothetical protein
MSRPRPLLVVLVLCALCASCETSPSPTLPDSGVPDWDGGPTDSGDGGPDSGFGWPHDGGPVVDLCDPVAQSGCPAAGTKCIVENPIPAGGTHCVRTSTADLARDQTCSVGGACVGGLACVATSTSGGHCEAVCDLRSNAGCAAPEECAFPLLNTNWGVCIVPPPMCDALSGLPCAPDEACSVYVHPGGTTDLRCQHAGAGVMGSPCESAVDCGRGLLCITFSGASSCRKICQNGGDCASTDACDIEIRSLSLHVCGPM